MKKLRIVFMGTASFAVPCLEKIMANGYDVVAVVTTPDLPRGRGQKVSYTPVKEFAVSRGIPVLQPEKLKDPEFIGALKTLNADLFLVVAYRILPPEVFEIPRMGSVNLHGSLLPKFRGAAPINWAIIRGEKETGVTTFFIQKKVDTGNVILQKRTPIGDDESAGELHDRLAGIGAETLLETVRMIEKGNVPLRPQDDQEATSAPKIFKGDCRIHWDRPAIEIKNFVRGLSPYPCAFAAFRGEPYKIFRVAVDDDQTTQPPGTVLESSTEKGIRVACGNGSTLSITELQPPSKKRLSAADFLRGNKMPERWDP